jgi:hypothetical protein
MGMIKVTRRWKHAPKHGQSALINILWRRFGGPKKVAALVGVPTYQPGNWDREGQVPVKYLMLVASKLELPIWGLNYKAAKALHFAEKVPAWESVVKMYNLDKHVEKEVLKLGEP